MSRHTLNSFDIQKCYQKEPNSGYSRSSLSKIRIWAYVKNIYEYKSIATG